MCRESRQLIQDLKSKQSALWGALPRLGRQPRRPPRSSPQPDWDQAWMPCSGESEISQGCLIGTVCCARTRCFAATPLTICTYPALTDTGRNSSNTPPPVPTMLCDPARPVLERVPDHPQIPDPIPCEKQGVYRREEGDILFTFG